MVLAVLTFALYSSLIVFCDSANQDFFSKTGALEGPSRATFIKGSDDLITSASYAAAAALSALASKQLLIEDLRNRITEMGKHLKVEEEQYERLRKVAETFSKVAGNSDFEVEKMGRTFIKNIIL